MNKNFELIRNYSLFIDLSDEECKGLVQHSQLANFNKTSFIEEPHTISKNVYIVKKGLIKGGIFSDEGHELNSLRFTDNDIFGFFSLFDDNASDFFYQAIETSTVITIKSSYFSLLMKKNGEFGYKIFQLVGKTLALSVRKRVENVFYNNKNQIILFLFHLTNQQGKKIGKEILVKHKMTNQDMANFIGCSRQSVSQVINELKKEGIIYSSDRKSFLVRDLEQLKNKVKDSK